MARRSTAARALLLTLCALPLAAARAQPPPPGAAVPGKPAAPSAATAAAPAPAATAAPAPAAASTPAPAAAPAAPEKVPTERLTEEKLRLRDPFKHPQRAARELVKRSELESIAVDSFKMVGISTGPDQARAMLVGNGKTFFVRERMKIGLRGGFIKRITSEAVYVREKIVNAIGQEEDVDTPIKFTPDKKDGTQTATLGR